ncbi:MAG: hypothetical protein IPP27_08690 [Bacteroidetes bacterium]|nr:hypothetical protein [Bacteroidota bacterium]
MFTLGEKAKCLTVPEAVYLCHFSEYPINLKNCQKIADHFGKQNGHSLYKEYKKNITSGDFTAGVNEKELDLKRINLLQNIIPLLSRKEHSITANNTLKKLKANYTNGLETGLYDELKKKNEQ